MQNIGSVMLLLPLDLQPSWTRSTRRPNYYGPNETRTHHGHPEVDRPLPIRFATVVGTRGTTPRTASTPNRSVRSAAGWDTLREHVGKRNSEKRVGLVGRLHFFMGMDTRPWWSWRVVIFITTLQPHCHRLLQLSNMLRVCVERQWQSVRKNLLPS